MPKPKDFRVIPGGKLSEPPAADPASCAASQLLERVRRYRELLPDPPSDEARSLLSDFEDAVEALRRLEFATGAGTQARIAEYRRLIAELDTEIAAVWLAGDPKR